MPRGVLASRVCTRKNPKSLPPYTSNNIVDAILNVVVDVIVNVIDVVVGKKKKRGKSDFSIKIRVISDNSDFSIFFFFWGGGPPIFVLAIFHLVLP
jgi:hypothetical protein